MENRSVAVCHSLFDLQGLARLLERDYFVQGTPPLNVRLLSRSSNDLYRVSAGADTYLLRVSPHGSREAHVRGEVDLLHDLSQAALRVPRPLPTRDGVYLWALDAPEGRRWGVLLGYIEGTMLRWAVDETACHKLGALCGVFHAWGDNAGGRAYSRPCLDAGFLLDDPIERVERGEYLTAQEQAWARSAAEKIRPYLAVLPQKAPYYGVCHGDVHHGNALVCGEGMALLDFDFCGYGYRVYDLATYQASVWNESRQAAFFAGYETVRPISAEERRLLPYFVVARQIWVLGHIARGEALWGQVWVLDRMKSIMDHLRGVVEGLEPIGAAGP